MQSSSPTKGKENGVTCLKCISVRLVGFICDAGLFPIFSELSRKCFIQGTLSRDWILVTFPFRCLLVTCLITTEKHVQQQPSLSSTVWRVSLLMHCPQSLRQCLLRSVKRWEMFSISSAITAVWVVHAVILNDDNCLSFYRHLRTVTLGLFSLPSLHMSQSGMKFLFILPIFFSNRTGDEKLTKSWATESCLILE